MRALDFAAAWAIADRVLAARDPATRDDPTLPYHLRWVWDGTPPDGRRVLVRCYHGLGDTLQFARLLPELRARAAYLTLEVQAALVPLLAGLPGVDRLIAFDPAAPLPPSACDIEIMELGHVLRVEAARISAAVPYLRAPEMADTDKFAADAMGLCWRAGAWDPSRSLTLAGLLAALPPGRTLVSLQRGAAATDAGQHFANPGDTDESMARTASLAAACSCVVTVDTMVAHLAGALGRPVVVLLKADADWRWPDTGAATPWYPTATLVRQNRPGGWDQVFRQLGPAISACLTRS